MKDRFIRCLSPITFFVVLALDIGIILFGVYAIQGIIKSQNIWTIMFVIIEVLIFIVGILVTKEIFKNGICFRENEVEFTGIDDNNIFQYESIEKIETNRDTKASLKKNFIDRYTTIIIYNKDDSVVTVNLGLTTKRTLKNIIKEFNIRLKKHLED